VQPVVVKLEFIHSLVKRAARKPSAGQLRKHHHTPGINRLVAPMYTS
jgi:hypothetical protein